MLNWVKGYEVKVKIFTNLLYVVLHEKYVGCVMKKYSYKSALWCYKGTCSITLIANIFYKYGLDFLCPSICPWKRWKNKSVLKDWI